MSIMAALPNLQQVWIYMAVISKPFAFSILCTALLLLLHNLIINRSSKVNLPPSPRRLPIIGHLHHLGRLPHRSLKSLSEKYGPLMFLCLGQTPTLVVSSEEAAMEVMNTQDLVFSNRPQTTAAKIFAYGCQDIGFGPYGEYWRQAKKICKLELLSVKSVQSFQYVREEEVSALIDKVRCACKCGYFVDLSQMLLAVSNNITSRCVVGRKAEEEGDDKSKFGELSRRMLLQLVAFSFGDIFPALGWMDKITGLKAQLQATSRQLDVFLDQVIEEHRMMDSDDPQFGRKDLLHVILQLLKDGTLGVQLTQDNIKAILLDMIVGGTDTTATLMEWTMAELIKNKDVLRKAQEEVRRVAGKKSESPIYFFDIDKLNYLKCIIKETLRHPPLPLLGPRQTSTSAQLKGYTIPPKTTVLINAFAIHMDPKVWEKPEKLIPERFEKEKIDFKAQDFSFLPFGSGRRGCPGISFGIVSAEFVLANLLYWFDWTLPGSESPEDLDMSESHGLTVTKKIHLHLMPAMYSP